MWRVFVFFVFLREPTRSLSLFVLPQGVCTACSRPDRLLLVGVLRTVFCFFYILPTQIMLCIAVVTSQPSRVTCHHHDNRTPWVANYHPENTYDEFMIPPDTGFVSALNLIGQLFWTVKIFQSRAAS